MSNLLKDPVRRAALSALIAATIAAVLITLGLAARGGCWLGLEFAGSTDDFTRMLTDECQGESEQTTILLASLFLAGSVLLAIVCWIGCRLIYAARSDRFLHVARRIAMVAAFLCVFELVLILVAISFESTRDLLAPAIEAAAHVRWVSMTIAVVGSVVVVVAVLSRLWVSRGQERLGKELDSTLAGADQGADPGSVRAQNYCVPPPETAPSSPVTGVCLSGGGIRSAIFAMGAMQVFAQRRRLECVDYLSVVSGGSYFGGAHQMLRAHSVLEPANVRVGLDEAFEPGSAEEDWVRRHGKYIADGSWEWLVAIGVVARNVLLGLILISATLVVAAGVFGATYSIAGDWAKQVFQPLQETGWDWPDFTLGSWAALAVPFGLAALAWIFSGLPRKDVHMLNVRLAPSQLPQSTGPAKAAAPVTRPNAEQSDNAGDMEIKRSTRPLTTPKVSFEREPWRKVLRRWAIVLLVIAVGVLAVVFLGPTLVRVSEWSFAREPDIVLPQLGTLIALATVATTVWNILTKVQNQPDAGKAGDVSLIRRLGNRASFATRALLSAAVLLVLVLVALALFADQLRSSIQWHLNGRMGIDWQLLGAAAALLIIGLSFDQTRMSLHEFYKRRLWGAFAVERTSPTNAAAVDYGVRTKLSEYGKPPPGQKPAGPELLVCAAVNISGPDLAPPGRRVTPLVFSWRYIGGPRLGYVKTEDYEEIVDGTSYRSDATLMAAMAISGAAFASAMGRMSSPFAALLSISNARLGAWLPNPAYLVARSRAVGQASFAEATGLAPIEMLPKRLPKLRRISYWAREIFGIYGPKDRFVYVSDGGHYENLGLVELLRRRCEIIYCIDASGDSMASTLAQAALLAWEELGVRISVAGLDLVPHMAAGGNADDMDVRLQKRLASKSVVAGTLEYPEIDGLPHSTGRLVVGKAVLTKEIDFPLKVHAIGSTKFPSDSTADQWFDVNQFDAYQALGQAVGTAMLDLDEPPKQADEVTSHEPANRARSTSKPFI